MTTVEARALPGWVDGELYPFAAHWLRLPGGESIHYLDEGPDGGGDGTLVFVHGTPTWSFDWRGLVTAFSNTHRCVALDHLGFGLSERPWGAAYTPEAHAERFRLWMEALDLRDVTLVVHDFGGPIALPVALERGLHAERGEGRVSRLVVLNSWMWSLAGDPHIARGARLMSSGLGRWMYRSLNASLRIITPSAYADRKKLTKRIHAQLLAPFVGIDSRERVLWALAKSLLGSSDFYAGLWERRAALAELPALIVWGTKDPAFPHSYVERWREALPHAAVLELPVGHWPHEEAPAEVEQALRELLADR